ncbi:MAG: hypothetical protein OHK0017_06980 [Patescibacteria group bacterium]
MSQSEQGTINRINFLAKALLYTFLALLILTILSIATPYLFNGYLFAFFVLFILFPAFYFPWFLLLSIINFGLTFVLRFRPTIILASATLIINFIGLTIHSLILNYFGIIVALGMVTINLILIVDLFKLSKSRKAQRIF